MTKADIVKAISNEIGVDKTTVLETVEAFMNNVQKSLSNNQCVYLRGFGSFIVKYKAEKPARNITKNTTVVIPSHWAPAFKPSKKFLEKVKKNVK